MDEAKLRYQANKSQEEIEMGYHTDYQLDVTPNNGAICDLVTEYMEFRETDSWLHILAMDWSLLDATWYEHEEDMQRISAHFPELLFTLRGVGEEHGDVWTKKFKAGECIYSMTEAEEAEEIYNKKIDELVQALIDSTTKLTELSMSEYGVDLQILSNRDLIEKYKRSCS